MIRRTFIFIFFFSFLPLAALAAKKPFIVVIDPGHGGQDHGATVRVGSEVVREKEITLELARQLAEELKSNSIQAILTRSRDQHMELPERTALANRIGADVFLSIHMNSAQNSGARAEGIETFILNTSTDARSKRLADLENAVLEGSKADQLAVSDVNLILKDLILDANREASASLACNIQHSLAAHGRRDRGVKQALFYVLLGADMPSVLVETGFLDNPMDRGLVRTPEGRARIARSITRAVLEFRKQRTPASRQRTLSRCKIH